jgi:hypothetical protein
MKATCGQPRQRRNINIKKENRALLKHAKAGAGTSLSLVLAGGGFSRLAGVLLPHGHMYVI